MELDLSRWAPVIPMFVGSLALVVGTCCRTHVVIRFPLCQVAPLNGAGLQMGRREINPKTQLRPHWPNNSTYIFFNPGILNLRGKCRKLGKSSKRFQGRSATTQICTAAPKIHLFWFLGLPRTTTKMSMIFLSSHALLITRICSGTASNN